MRHISALLLALILILAFSPRLLAADDDKESAPAKKEKNKDDKEDENRIPIHFDALKTLDYPELQVVPRASERLRQEALEEPNRKFYVSWPIQVAGLANIILGLNADSYYKQMSDSETDDADAAAQSALIVGGIWLVGMGLYSSIEHYTEPYQKIKKIPETDRRSELRRERMAEEALERPAVAIKTIKYISLISNLGIALYAGSFTKGTGSVYAGIAAGMSFLPFIFEHHYVEVYDRHLQYKRKIYKPVSLMGITNVAENQFTPTLNFQWSF